ncbi:hypothetical protein EJB05_10540, partial [Eragrostis curvula]
NAGNTGLLTAQLGKAAEKSDHYWWGPTRAPNQGRAAGGFANRGNISRDPSSSPAYKTSSPELIASCRPPVHHLLISSHHQPTCQRRNQISHLLASRLANLLPPAISRASSAAASLIWFSTKKEGTTLGNAERCACMLESYLVRELAG